MRLLIDNTQVELINKAYEFYPISGVTTNPTILSKVGGNPFEILRQIREMIGEEEMHVQVISTKADEIVEEAKHIVNILGRETFVKIPAIDEGFKAMKILSYTTEISFTATAVYTTMQAFIAAECGAAYVAPYVNRIDNLGYNGIEVVKQIKNFLINNGMETEILAASFKNSQQVVELLEYGIDAVTVAPDILKNFVKNAAVDSAIKDFINDFESFAGEGKTMKDFK